MCENYDKEACEFTSPVAPAGFGYIEASVPGVALDENMTGTAH